MLLKMGIFSIGPTILFFNFLLIQGSTDGRLRRDTGGSQSLLTVEWEGIQTGDHPDDSVGGFAVEYRAEKDTQWHVHDGIIPYKGPNLQYRVQIPRLPTGIAYFVRIKVLGKNGKILVETPEIRARNEMVSIKCESEDLTSPRNLEITQTGQYSIAISWEPPECGSVGEYHIELSGADMMFDVHRQTVTHPSVSVTNLLPGTKYHIRIRAVDRAHNLGPWNEEELNAQTDGNAPDISEDIDIDYRSDTELRISWAPYSQKEPEYYEVMAVEVDSDERSVERTRIEPYLDSFMFGGLKPNTEYHIGVVTFVSHEPVLIYKLLSKTAPIPPVSFTSQPTVASEGAHNISLHWKKPDVEQTIENFVIEYRLPNETNWRKYGDMIFDDDTEIYKIAVDRVPDSALYSVRILAVDDHLRLVAKTTEIAVGEAASESCAGEAGVPLNVHASYVSESTIQFTWGKPECDETYGPIDGYEYLFWNAESDSQSDVASYVGRNAVALNDLTPNTRYAFRVRSRAGHGYSTWSDIVHTTTETHSGSLDARNIYQLRIVLSPPNSYLVWTPLQEHQKDVAEFKLSYKISSSAEWTRIIKKADEFTCPEGIADSEDYCFDLSELKYGVQYTADIVYKLKSGEWTTSGSPLFFILVEAGEPTTPSSPNNLQISPRDSSSVEVRWLPPLSSVHIHYYQISVEDVHSKQIRNEKVPGTYFAHVVSQLSPYSTYNISVRGGTEHDELGPAASNIISLQRFIGHTEKESQVPSKPSIGIEKPRIEQRGVRTIVYWNVGGDTSLIVAYQIDLRAETDRTWRQHDGYVPHQPGETHFRHELTNLHTHGRYYVRISAIDSSRRTVAMSETTSFTVQCQAPSATPQNLRLTTIADGVLLSWSYSSEDSIDCEPYFLLAGYQNGVPLTEKIDGHLREYHLKGSTVGEWQLELRAGNRVGSGPASAPVNLVTPLQQANNIRIHRSVCDPRTDFWCRPSIDIVDHSTYQESVEELTSMPRITAKGSDLLIEWKSTGNGRGVFGYRIQFRTPTTGWTPYGQLVPYIGDNEQYSQVLTGLEQGNLYYIHVQVLDRNSYVMYVSPEVSARITCSAPTHPPSHLQIEAPDARHIRVTWMQVPQSTWMCNEIQIELEVTEPTRLPLVILDGRQTSHVLNTQPNQQWSVRVRTKNSAGHSPWSQTVSTRTAPAGELIIGPTVSFRQGIPVLTWNSLERVEDIVKSYQVEWRSSVSPSWQKYRESVPYTGWQRPYTIEMKDLVPGQYYQIRINAIDANNAVSYTTSVVNVQAQRMCSPPRRAPINVHATAIGPTQIRVSWHPLHETEWNCDQIWYVVKYSTPRDQGFRNLTRGENQVVFDSKPFTQWTFEVQAANPAGESVWSKSVTAQTQGTAPGPISDLRIYTISPDSLQLSWRPPENPNGQITGYEITYQLLSKGLCDQVSDRPITVTSNRPSYTLRGLSPHSNYRISVAAKTNIAGEPLSQEVQTDQSIPTASPLYIRSESKTHDTLDISWQAPPCIHTNGEITEYEYEIKVADGDPSQKPVVNTVRGNTRTRISGLRPLRKYYVRLRAYTRKGPGPWSQPVIMQTAPSQEISPPPVVKLLTADSNQAHLLWQEPDKAYGHVDRFKCQYSVVGTRDYREKQFPATNPCSKEISRIAGLPVSPTGPRWHCGTIGGLQPEKEYEFRVSAGSPDGAWSPWSRPEKGSLSEEPVQILSIQKIGGSATNLQIVWNIKPTDISRVSGFRIHVAPLEYRAQPQIFTVDRSTMQYQVDNLKPNSDYNITVEAAVGSRYHSGTSVRMRTDSLSPTDTLLRPKVIEEQATSVTVEWSAPRIDVGGFIVEYRLGDGVWLEYPKRIPAYPGRRTYTAKVEQLPTNNAVDIRVRGVSLQNEKLSPGPEIRARTKCSAPPFPPQAIRIDAPTTNEVRVSWARPAKDTWQCDQLNFEIAYRVGNDAEKIIPVAGDQTEYSFPADANSRWAIKVRSSNQVGASPWSTVQTIATKQGVPGSVRNLRLRAIGPNEVLVQWSAPIVQRGTIVGYDISYRLKHRLACPDEEPRDVSRDFITVYNHKDLEYTLTGLLPFSLYEVRVRARTTELGPEETKDIVTEQQPPSAPPLNLQLGYALERSINFQWEEVECSQRHGHIVNYEYEILGQDDWAKLERQIANTTNTYITIDGLTPFTKYVMRVKAYNSVGGGPNTENLDAMTSKADAPLPPQDLVVAQEGTNSFMISWLPPYPPYGPHDAYKIRYQILNANSWTNIEKDVDDHLLQCPADSPRFCFNITNLEHGQQYRAQVATRIEGGSYGPWSTVIIANTLQILPDAPRAIELIAKTHHSLHIRWLPPADPLGHITQYKVNIVSMEDPQGQIITHLVDHPNLQFLFSNLLPETSYNVSISAGTSRGFGPEIWTRYSTNPFKVPGILAAPELRPDNANALDVQWNGVPDPNGRIRGYIIEYRPSDTPTFTEYSGIIEQEANKEKYNQKMHNLNADTLYFVRIKVIDKKQRISEPSPEANARTGCAVPISPPSNVNVHSPSSTQIRISWQAPSQSSWRCSNIRYKIEYMNGTSPRHQIDVPSGVTEKVIDSAPNTLWRVRVRLENDAGASDWSKEVSIRTSEGAPGTVEGLTARSDGPNSAIVSWNQPIQTNGIITGYAVIYRLKSIGECGPRSSRPITKNVQDEKLVLDGLLPDSTYEIYVIAHTSQAGPQSSPVTFTTEESIPTGPPLNVRMSSVTQTKGDLLWNEPECEMRHGKIIGYDYVLQSLDIWAENESDYTTLQKVYFDKLVPYTRYRVRVRAKNSVGHGPFSDWISFQTHPSAPFAPSDLVEEQSFPHAIEISFIPPVPPHGLINEYRIRHTPTGQRNFKEVRVGVEHLQCSDSSKKNRLCYRVVNLDPELEYEIQAAAHSVGGGWGTWSEPLLASTHEQNIPVLERELEVVDIKPTSITVRWRGLDGDQAAHIVGYVVEYKSEADDDEWKEYNGITKHKPRMNEYKINVRQLESATEYFFRLKVVGKNDKRGSPGPETKATTLCGRPEAPPEEVKLEPIDFETLKVSWRKPEKTTWNCKDVEYLIEFVNTTSRGVISAPSDSKEMLLSTLPGTKWDIKMRTQTLEEGYKPNYSPWSDRVTLITQALPGEIFVKVEPKGPETAHVMWDLADQDQKWNYGVDITYKLKQLGGCAESRSGDHEPITKYNVQDKLIILDDLKPGSEYEIIVTPRRPPTLHSSVVSPKTVRRFRTKTDLPSGPPMNLRVDSRRNTEIGFKWDPPVCASQNGKITQYEFEVVGDEEWNDDKREGVTPRTNVVVDQLKPGSLYNVRVRAYTSEGAGPWSNSIQIRTTGSELGPPRELTAVQTKAKSVQLTWLPPYPERTPVVAYKFKYSPRADDSNPMLLEVSGDDLSCQGYKSPLITSENLCTTIKSLQPDTTYSFAVQAQSTSSNWGEWSPTYFATTRSADDGPIPGKLRLVSAGHDNLRVNWIVPPVIREMIDRYLVTISVASAFDQYPKEFNTPGSQNDFHFRGLEPVTHYNITVQGLSKGKHLWFISEIFATTDYAEGLLSWLPAPTDLKLLEKADTMMHVAWSPPEIFDPQYKDLITHYRITIAPYDKITSTTGRIKNYTVPYPGTSIKFEDLNPETIYNITVQAGTNSGYGQILWGIYSTLAPDQSHILKLIHRTPTTLTVGWEPTSRMNQGYTLTWTSLHSVFPHVRLDKIKSTTIDSGIRNYTIENLEPSTIYNVTLQPKGSAESAWGAYATLPPGWFIVRNFVWCDRTNYAISLNWEPLPLKLATHYQVQYLRLKEHGTAWIKEEERRAVELLCPKDGCNRQCYLVFNLEHNPDEYIFQIRAKVNGQWNHWKTAGKPAVFEKPERKAACCIVPPPYPVENIGLPGTFWEVDIAPVESRPQNISRYYVVVDEREPAGSTNWTELTDKVTATKLKLPYYVAASFNADTLPTPTKVKIGDGTVIGGYLNYPLVKGKKYNYEIYSVWELDGKPAVVARQRASAYAISGWPWWWLLLLLLLLLFLILLTCCLLWCLQGRYRTTKHRRITTNGQTVPLLSDAEKSGMEQNMQALSSRVEDIRSSLEQKAAARGDFEDGYVRGFRDANKLGSASAARRRMDDDYGARDDRFHEGYVKGLRDAGMTGMSSSMHNLAQRGQGGGYSSGYMQGFRDGNSGVFGDRISTNLLRRLEEQYPNQEEFRTGYIDGFKEGANSRLSERKTFEESRRLQESLTKLTEILQDKSKGDEIHTTKIYHVYNQQPDVGMLYSTNRQLEHELEELTSSSRRSTLRRHYTPGDYLKYNSETEGYGSLGRNRRSLSASALGRETADRSRYFSGTGTSYISRTSAAERSTVDTSSQRYNYRSRSDMGSPRRYASQTLLDGIRPGPSASHIRRDALHTLQKELDTLSRSPDRSTPRGYSSDTGYMNDTFRSRARGSATVSATRIPVSIPVKTVTSSTFSTSQKGSATETSPSSRQWPDDLIDIVNEPMGQTLERMKKYSNSMSQVDREGDGDDNIKESTEEHYQRSYKEEYTTGRR